MRNRSLATVAMAAWLGVTGCVGATDLITQSADGSIRLSGGIGLMNLDASEYVYDNGSKLSQLDWESRAVTVYTATIKADLSTDWTVKTTFTYGDGGDSHMVDYDWIAPFNDGDGMDGWSDRSIHADTRLKYYFDSAVEIGRPVYVTDTGTLGIAGGFRYTDIRWDAYGGSYVYSTDAPRDTVGDFPDGERGISYRQRIPVVYAGVNGSGVMGRFGFSGGANLGMTSGINDIDFHWARALRFDDSMDAAPVVMLNAETTYALTDMASLYLGASFENVFHQDGNVRVVNIANGERDSGQNAAGAAFRSVAISFGLKGRF